MALAIGLLGGTGVSQPLAAAVPAATAKRIADLRKRIDADNRNHPVASVALAQEALQLLKPDEEPAIRTALLIGLVRDLNVLLRIPEAEARLAEARAQVAHAGQPRDHFLVGMEGALVLILKERPGDARPVLEGLIPAMEGYLKKQPEDSEIHRLLGRAQRSLGTANRDLGRFPEAIGWYQRAMKTYQEAQDSAGLSNVLDQMGTLLQLLGRLDEAVSYHRQAIATAEPLKNPELLATIHLNFANTYGFLNDTDHQLEELAKSRELARISQDPDIELTVAVNMADAYLRKKDYRTCLKYAEAGLRLAREAGNAASIAVSQVNQGIALNRLGNSAEGLKAIVAGLEHFKASQARNDTAEIVGILAEEYAFAGEWRKAYETELQFKALSDDLKRVQDQKHIADASAAFEIDKKQLQIDALNRERRNQLRLRFLWTAIGLLGLGTAAVLVAGRKKLQAANKALADMSLRDPLTSLANRRYLTSRIAEDLAQIHRLQRSGLTEAGKTRMPLNIDVIFFMIDIDHFKQVNDTHGHAAGDQVLRQFASILSSTMRDSDTVVRWGGEEFFVVAKHTSRTEAHIVAERIRSRVEAFPFDIGEGRIVHKTCSVGFATYPFFRKDPALVAWEKVAEVADQCLYAAKASGRNTWVGVHEAEDGPDADLKERLGAYPDVAKLVADGILRAEAMAERPIAWNS
ncbi:tetratricopeptide repeat-containing diguanylate cyclase [Mesoterricola sediminis]|uniref:diguanylate cyclase n=1 Tax=Mesoterricola sediminis TaxID=2927980 RepID=A0AA48HB34_9BACT|nr:tetratricopeptide repeat-containing diguanylate cyclase [Mesoterricola sediminis]BDU75048.1 hypothetical protein METESE_00060 [Mesoterricola sediminis]